MDEWPISSDEDALGRIGVHMVGIKVTKLLGWVFRETSNSDLGIDAEIEVRNPDKSSHGRLISVQVKCGDSYLRERTDSGYVYRGSYSHLRYWTEHTTPVIVVLCDPHTERCWWQTVDLQGVSFHDKGWSLEIPFDNVFSESSAAKLRAVSARLQKKDIVELLFRDWLGWSFEHKIRFASLLASPRDYRWFSHLAATDDSFLMIDYLLSDIHGFDERELEKMLEAAKYNHKEYGYERLLLGFISEIPSLLQRLPDPIEIMGVTVEYVPLLLDMRGEPTLTEVGKDGKVIRFYEEGQAIDDWAGTVERAIKRTVPGLLVCYFQLRCLASLLSA